MNNKKKTKKKNKLNFLQELYSDIELNQKLQEIQRFVGLKEVRKTTTTEPLLQQVFRVDVQDEPTKVYQYKNLSKKLTPHR